ncbi:MAG: SpoIIE family protein phosphatase, partial [Actinomycetota bacterium]
MTTAARHEVEHAAFRVLSDADSLEEAAPQILHGICEALGWRYGGLWTLDDTGKLVRCVETYCEDGSEPLEEFISITKRSVRARGEGIPGRVWESGSPAWIPDLRTDPNHPRKEIGVAAGLRGALGFPISVRDEFFGAMEFFSEDVQAPDEEVNEMLLEISRRIGAFIEREHMEAELHFQKALLEYQGEAALDGIGVISPDMRVLYWNQRILKIFDISEDEVREGDASAIIDRLIPDAADPEATRDFVRDVLPDPIAEQRLEVPMADGRILDVWTAPVRGPEGELFGRAIYCRDITDQKVAEQRIRESEEWTTFLADATSVLSEELDLQAIMERFASLAVPALADWCAVHVVDKVGTPQSLAVAHVDPEKVKAARELQEQYPPDQSSDTGVYGVIKTGTPLLLTEIPETMVVDTAQNEHHLQLLRDLDLRSAIVVPITAREHVLGAITLIGAESGRRYTERDVRRAEELANRAAYAIDNARLYEETRDVAQTLQKSFLPPDLPDVPGVDISARYFAAGEGELIGGDFYDAFRIDNRRWGLVLGDVSGKGLEAATVTTLARHVIRGAAFSARTPSEVLNVLNTALVEQNQTDRFCTAIYAIVEPRFARVRVTVSSGGHPPPYVIRNNGRVEPVECTGTLLGFIDDIKLRDVTIELEFGDKFFLYTDGVLDIRQKGGTFGQEGLERLLEECSKRGTESAAEHISRTVAHLQAGQAT